MSTVIQAVARSAAAAVPLTILALGLLFVAVVGVLRPTQARQDMVVRLGRAIKDVGREIVGQGDRRRG